MGSAASTAEGAAAPAASGVRPAGSPNALSAVSPRSTTRGSGCPRSRCACIRRIDGGPRTATIQAEENQVPYGKTHHQDGPKRTQRNVAHTCVAREIGSRFNRLPETWNYQRLPWRVKAGREARAARCCASEDARTHFDPMRDRRARPVICAVLARTCYASVSGRWKGARSTCLDVVTIDQGFWVVVHARSRTTISR